MSQIRIALAAAPIPASPDDAVAHALQMIEDAGERGARIACFPEAYVPGYRIGRHVPAPDPLFLEHAWTRIGDAAARAGVGIVLGTERVVEDKPMLTALVIDEHGRRLGFQDKVQLDPSEDATYVAGRERAVFTVAGATIGVAICHEGWRYPETVRWAARQGAQIVFHPHFHEPEAGAFAPASFADPRNTFHEKSMLCRAAENTCFVATVNCAAPGAPTACAVISPDGTLLAHQPYGVAGVLVADVDLAKATRLLATRYKPLA